MSAAIGEGDEMDLLLTLMIILVALTVLGAFAAAVGTDSRDSIGDDWVRRTGA